MIGAGRKRVRTSRNRREGIDFRWPRSSPEVVLQCNGDAITAWQLDQAHAVSRNTNLIYGDVAGKALEDNGITWASRVAGRRAGIAPAAFPAPWPAVALMFRI